jgi:hypothetical protein
MNYFTVIGYLDSSTETFNVSVSAKTLNEAIHKAAKTLIRKAEAGWLTEEGIVIVDVLEGKYPSALDETRATSFASDWPKS